MTKYFAVNAFLLFFANVIFAQDFSFSNQCIGDSTQFSISGASVDSVFWDFGEPLFNTDTTSLTNPKWLFSSTGTFSVKMKYYVGAVIDSVSHSVDIFALPTVNLGGDKTACTGTSLTLSSSGSTGTYLWSDNSTSPTLSVNSSGTYKLYVTDSNNCVNVDSSIVVFDGPTIDVADQEICMGGNGSLDAGTGYSSYSWSNGSSTQTTQVTSGGVFTITVYDANGCSASDNVVVTEVPGPDLYDYSQVPVSTVSLGFATLYASGGTGNLEYQIVGRGDFQSANQFSGLNAGTYNAIVRDELGCTDELSIEILSNEDPVEPSDGFSPNNDGVNDDWQIQKIEIYPEAIVRVFDRWNKLVFESKGNYQPWKGTFNGGFVPSGTYFYYIDLKNGSKAQVGFMTIIR